MNQEEKPLRSRRELRATRAQTEVQDGETPSGDAPTPVTSQSSAQSDSVATGRIRRVADVPVDAIPERKPAERSSQIRARDRAALRTIKQLAEKEEQLSGGLPTRRQLRLQQLKAQAATAGTNPPTVEPPSMGVTAGIGLVSPAVRGADSPAPAPGDAVNPADMSVEEALAERSKLEKAAQEHFAALENLGPQDPETVDPEILAQQIALAERAAILNRRARAKQKLAEEHQQRTQPSHDPTATNNLAMMAPQETVQVPGVGHPVLRRPATSHVPVVPALLPRTAAPKRGADTSSTDKPGTPVSGRSEILARAEAVARANGEVVDEPARDGAEPHNDAELQSPRVAARAAYGLDPLDAATAGLAHAQRVRLMQLAVFAVGIITLIAGIIMLITGLNS
ncbi:hypothetical protein ACQQCD_09995 [Pseudarthrobacter sp. J1763]|uniref:hypothetical protein n=1 Tax=Pseudarthrobacter sp. J1763 TaxID=3420445 RepID=UPI003D2D4BE7